MQRLHRVLIDLRVFLAATLSVVSSTLQHSPFPLMNHGRMHAIFDCQFGYCALSFQDLERHTCFVTRIMVSALLHILISSPLKTSRRQIVASVTVQFSGRNSLKEAGRLLERHSKQHLHGQVGLDQRIVMLGLSATLTGRRGLPGHGEL